MPMEDRSAQAASVISGSRGSNIISDIATKIRAKKSFGIPHSEPEGVPLLLLLHSSLGITNQFCQFPIEYEDHHPATSENKFSTVEKNWGVFVLVGCALMI